MAVFVPIQSSGCPYGYGRCHTLRTHQRRNVNPLDDLFSSMLHDTLSSWPVVLAQTLSAEKPKFWHKELVVRGFTPDEIKVEEKDGFLKIHARHEERDGEDVDLTELVRNVKLPSGVEPSSVKTTYKAGRLVLKGEFRKEEKATGEESKAPEDSSTATNTEEKEPVLPSDDEAMADAGKSADSTVDGGADKEADREPETHSGEDPSQTSVMKSQEPFKVTFHLPGFGPDDISVRTEGRHLVVKAERKEESDDITSYQIVERRMLLPKNINAEETKSVLAGDGTLTVIAPNGNIPSLENTVPVVTE